MLKQGLKQAVSHLLEKSNKDIMACIDCHEVISFDIFDTLVSRDLPSQTNLLRCISKEGSRLLNCTPDSFIERRINAEKQLLEQCVFGEEITHQSIYSLMGADYDTARLLVEAEEAVEIATAQKHRLGYELLQYAILSKKTVILTSDMYLSEDAVRAILEKIGIDGFQHLYLSSQVGLTKRSGKLYQHIAVDLNIKNSELLHIGNDLISDYFLAKRQGFDARIICQECCVTLVRSKKRTSDLSAFLRNHESPYYSDFEKIGYEVLGPMLVVFSSWLCSTLEPGDRIFFLAREGKVMQQAFSIMYPDLVQTTFYALLSRRSVISANLVDSRCYDDVLQRLKPVIPNGVTLNNLRELNLIHSHELDELAARFQIKPDREIDCYMGHIPLLEKQLLPIIRKNSLRNCNLARRYFRDMEVANGRAVLCDVGWRGSIQDGLSRLMPGTNFVGLYMGVEPGVDNTDAKQGLFYGQEGSKRVRAEIVFTRQVFELLFLNPVGSTVGYREVGDRVEPVLTDVEYSECESRQIKSLQRAALQFVCDYSHSSVRSIGWIPSVGDAYDAYRTFAVNPSKKNIELINGFKANDGEVWPLLPSRSLAHWIISPKKLIEEFRHSYCKAIYLKALFRVPLPYCRILSWLKR